MGPKIERICSDELKVLHITGKRESAGGRNKVCDSSSYFIIKIKVRSKIRGRWSSHEFCWGRQELARLISVLAIRHFGVSAVSKFIRPRSYLGLKTSWLRNISPFHHFSFVIVPSGSSLNVSAFPSNSSLYSYVLSFRPFGVFCRVERAVSNIY